MAELIWLDEQLWFPDTEQALDDPDGLLAVGGDLSPERLLLAYQMGIFPWYDDPQPILWWSPNPRFVLLPDQLHVSRKLEKTLRRELFDITLDQHFPEVIRNCAASRNGVEGTWITNSMENAYNELYRRGHAHSVEVWQDNDLVGGLYGVAIGKVFFGESMFSQVSNASKVGFVHFVRQLQHWGFRLIDCQIESEHLSRFGANRLPRTEFNRLLERWVKLPNAWQGQQNPENR